MSNEHNTTDNKKSDKLLQLVSFKVGNEEFGVDILKVQEINRMIEITQVPDSPPDVEGVVNLRGKVIPVVDLRKRFGLTSREETIHTRIIVVELTNQTVGFIVDEVKEVLRIPSSVMEPPPDLAVGRNADYIIGIGKLDNRLLTLLDLEKVMSN
ncbi:MAG: purine-binding chemotaxis protein CheW [Bacteroidetes bacterium]|jgi:purine-binding chemotaxis protein CheW|nr:purine-binding chemotaxis protein CheW [Bacteroidota bacterium]